MCSLTLSETFQAQLNGLGVTVGGKLEQNLSQRAFDANVDQKGLLDAPNTNLRVGFAADLRNAGIRKESIGRHRIFFTGSHEDCNYTAFYLKDNKKSDERQRDDNNPSFHDVLRVALSGQGARKVIPDPQTKQLIEKQEKVDQEATEGWKKAGWYRKYVLGEIDDND